MDLNKLKQLFLAVVILFSAPLKAQTPSPKQYFDPNLRFALPADSKVKMNWISAPIEDSVVKKGSVYSLCFGVDAYIQPWIGFHNEDIINPVKQYQFRLSPHYTNFTILDNGALIVATDNDLGYVAPPNYKNKDYSNRITAAIQPIASLPIGKCKIYPGIGNCLFLAGKNNANDQYEIYILAPEKSSTGISIRQYKKVFSSPQEFTGIAGDNTTIYISDYQHILKLNTINGSISGIPLKKLKGSITGLASNAQSGLFYSTDNGVGFIGTNSNFTFLACNDPQIYLRGTTLYVLLSKTMGVLSFDNITDLKRFDRDVEEVPATASTDVKPTLIRLFEGPSPAQPIAERKYTTSFGRDSIRYLYGELTLENLLFQKQPNKQIIEMVLTHPFSTNRESHKVLFDFGLNYASLVGWFQFGNGTLGSYYPGKYILTTYLNGIKIDAREFTITGKPTIVEAAAWNDSLKLRELIQNGADVNYKNMYGTTALMQISIMGDLESTKMLIDRGADVNARNSSGQSPLIAACMRFNNNAPVIKLLLDHKADPNAADNEKETPLIKAMTNYNTSPEIVKMLVDAGADINAKDAKGRTPLTCLSFWDKSVTTGQLLNYFIMKGVDANSCKPDGTPLTFEAVSAKNFYCLKSLLANGANPNVIGKNSATLYLDHSLLWCLLESYQYTTDLTDKQGILNAINFVCGKGGKLTAEEMKAESILYASYLKLLPYEIIDDIVSRKNESVMYLVTNDTIIQRIVIKRLMTLAYDDIVRATGSKDYLNALDICNDARDRAEKFNLISEIPEVYFDLGLLDMNVGFKEDCSRNFKKYLEMVPEGPLAMKAKSMLKKIEQ